MFEEPTMTVEEGTSTIIPINIITNIVEDAIVLTTTDQTAIIGSKL